tara:strand:- start:759 stop:1700 length:942 start_codon:yes stop_codon:yes gene_type:complete
MATLNEIAYNIKELMSGGNENIENNISTRQIKHWIHYHRAKIIEDKILNKSPIDRRYIQPLCSKIISIKDEFSLLGNTTSNIDFMAKSESFGWSNNDYHGTDYHEGTEFNRFSITVTLPHTLNISVNDGLTDIRLRKRLTNDDRTLTGRWMGWNKLPIKSKDNAAFDWANKFTKTNKPYAIVYNNMKTANDVTNGNDEMALEVSGLRYQAVENDSVTGTPAPKRYYDYWIDVWGILTNPTKAQKAVDYTGTGTVYEQFDDSVSHYPITEEDLPLLISRVAEIEMSLILKTPEDLVEDNVDTSKIKIGGGQQRQ